MAIDRFEYIPQDDILLIRLQEGKVARTLRRRPCILVDVDVNGKPISIEVVGFKSLSVDPHPLLDVLREF
ncbi:MAG TPA: DUF2283 domain-containing protein [Candidatus Xenobia bacterium]